MTPPVVFNSSPLPVTHLTAVEPPRDTRRVASLYFRDCTAVVLRRHGGDGGATAGARRWWRCYCGPCTVPRRSGRFRGAPLRIGPTCGCFEHVQSFHPATANVRGFWQFSAVLRRSMTAPLRNHGNHGGATAVYAVQAPQWHRTSGVTGV